MSYIKKNQKVEEPTLEEPKKKDWGDYILWGWVILLIVAGILMGYKFIAG
jgi:hypothetical protein